MIHQNIWCVGRNYSEHARELNNPIPNKPLIFLKSGACINTSSEIQLPEWTDEIHHECELAVLLSQSGEPKGLTLALDLTARSVQMERKKRGEPWTLAKSFIGSCPIGSWLDFPADFESLSFTLKKNTQLVQSGSTKDMIFSLDQLIHFIKNHFPLQENDILLTGTPAGVGPLHRGDVLDAEIKDLLKTHWQVS